MKPYDRMDIDSSKLVVKHLYLDEQFQHISGIESLRMVFYIKLNHNKRKMDSRVSLPASNYIGDDEMEETSTVS